MKTKYSILFLAVQLILFIIGFIYVITETYYFYMVAGIVYIIVFAAFSILIALLVMGISFLIKSTHKNNFSLLKGSIILWPIATLIIFGLEMYRFYEIDKEQEQRERKYRAEEDSMMKVSFQDIDEYTYIGYHSKLSNSMIVNRKGDTIHVSENRDRTIGLYQYKIQDIGINDTMDLGKRALEIATPLLNKTAADSILEALNHKLFCYQEIDHNRHELILPCDSGFQANKLLRIYLGPDIFGKKVISVIVAPEIRK